MKRLGELLAKTAEQSYQTVYDEEITKIIENFCAMLVALKRLQPEAVEQALTEFSVSVREGMNQLRDFFDT